MTTLSNLIQNHIISFILKNNIKFTLKPKKYIKQSVYNFHFDLNIKYYKSISKYSFVCKHWFYFIRTLFNHCSLSTFHDKYSIINTVGYQPIYYDRYKTIKINNEYSFFQFDNITHLFLDLNSIEDQNKAIDFIDKFSNLERIIISTQNIQLVNDITTKFTKLKVELYSIERNHDQKYNFNKLNDSIDFFHLDSIGSKIPQDKILNHYKRVNSLYLVYDDRCTGFEDHLEHSDIFTNKSLQYIKIEDDCVYAHDLIKVVKDNDHILSFRGSVPLFIFGCTEDEIVKSECRCYPHERDDESYLRDNKLEHWIEFCKHLSTNTTLKSFHLLNYCANDHVHHISEDTKQQMSESFCSALESNETLEYLTIPCGILTESFYKRFSEMNQSIRDICFGDVDITDLALIGNFIKDNRTIRTLTTIIRYWRNHNDDIDKDRISIETFLNGLKHNQTLITLEIRSRHNYIPVLNESILNSNEFKCNIKTNFNDYY